VYAVLTRSEVTTSTKTLFDGSGALAKPARKKKKAYKSVACAYLIVVWL
jgi:hypothetical protein